MRTIPIRPSPSRCWRCAYRGGRKRTKVEGPADGGQLPRRRYLGTTQNPKATETSPAQLPAGTSALRIRDVTVPAGEYLGTITFTGGPVAASARGNTQPPVGAIYPCSLHNGRSGLTCPHRPISPRSPPLRHQQRTAPGRTYAHHRYRRCCLRPYGRRPPVCRRRGRSATLSSPYPMVRRLMKDLPYVFLVGETAALSTCIPGILPA